MSPTTLFPAWVAHSRMGHNVLYGYATPFVGTSILLECPAIDGDEDYAPIAAEVHVLPLEGPAFYGLQVVDEATVRDRRARGRDWIGGRRALSVATTEPDVAVEVTAAPPPGALLRDLTPADLDALPVGSRFTDPDDGESTWWQIVKESGGWNVRGILHTSDNLIATWNGYAYALAPSSEAPEAEASDEPEAPAPEPPTPESPAPEANGYAPVAPGIGYRVFLSAASGVGYAVVEGVADSGEVRIRWTSGGSKGSEATLTAWDWANAPEIVDANGNVLRNEIPF